MAAIRNVAGPTLFKRFFGLIENQPLYVMVGVALGLAAYTPVRHFSSASDVALGPQGRDLSDALAPGGGRTLLKGASWRETGVLARAARLHRDVQVIPDYGVPDRSHFARDKPLYLPKEMPAPTA